MNAVCMLDYSCLAVEKEHQVNLLIKLRAPKAEGVTRKPLNLALVLDRSGSMDGAKLACTKEAVKTLVSHLSPADVLSVVTFESGVEICMEPTPVTNRDQIKQAVDRIVSGGTTNLSGGWIKGIELAGRNASAERLNRILLLTDGQANQGITEPGQLVSLGAGALQERGVATTALGFGDDFAEDLLTAIARSAGGQFYYIETPEAAPAVFREELQGLLALAAQNIEVRVTLRDPVALVRQWTGYTGKQEGKTITFALGDAYAEEEKGLLISLLVPGLAGIGQATIADVEVRYTEVSTAAVTMKSIRQPVMVNIADAAAAEQAKPVAEVLQELGLQMAAQARSQAVAEADRGKFAEAGNILRSANVNIGKLPGADDPRVQTECAALEEQAREMDDMARDTTARGSYSGTRKMMVSDAYNVSVGQYARTARERVRRRQPPTSTGSSPRTRKSPGTGPTKS